MGKKCIICSEKAEFCIKGSSEFYCEECAKENFSDISLLQTIEEQAKVIKDLIEQKEQRMDLVKTEEDDDDIFDEPDIDFDQDK